MTMHMMQTTTSLSATLAQVATLVAVKATSLGMSKTDKQASREVDQNRAAQSGTAKVSVQRLTPVGANRVREINALVAALGQDTRAMTTEWTLGQRMLANVRMQDWLMVFGKAKADWQVLVDAFVRDAPQLIADAYANLTNFNIAPPTEDEIRAAFTLDFEMMPVPDASSFKTSGLGAAVDQQLREHFEASITTAYQNATTDALTKVAEPLSRLVDRMEAYSKREEAKANGATVDKSGTFKDTITGNIDDVAKVFRSFNLTNDPMLDAIADKLDGLVGIKADHLRENGALRDDVVKKASDILADLKDLI